MSARMRVLAVSHDAFYGAPRVAIDVCGWLLDRGCQFEVVLLDGGPLEAEFRRLGPVHLAETPPRERIPPAGVRCIEQVLARWRPDVAYVSTVGALPALKVLRDAAIPVVLHVHELERVVRLYSAPFLADFLEVPSRYVAASDAVRRALLDGFPIEPARVVVAHEALDLHRVDRLLREAAEPDRDRPCIMLAGAGVCAPRKGTDLWLRVIAAVRARVGEATPVRGTWFGSRPSVESPDPFHRRVARLAGALGLGAHIEFTGHLLNYYPRLRHADVFLLPSREDACPLVVLDAMYLGKPVVTFAAGGAPELLAAGGGEIVPAHDVAGMADAVAALVGDADRRRRVGEAGRQRVRERFGIARLARNVERTLFDATRASGLAGAC